MSSRILLAAAAACVMAIGAALADDQLAQSYQRRDNSSDFRTKPNDPFKSDSSPWQHREKMEDPSSRYPKVQEPRMPAPPAAGFGNPSREPPRGNTTGKSLLR